MAKDNQLDGGKDMIYLMKVKNKSNGSTFLVDPKKGNEKKCTKKEAEALIEHIQRKFDELDDTQGFKRKHEIELFPIHAKNYMVYKLRGYI